MADFEWQSDEERAAFDAEVNRILTARESKGTPEPAAPAAPQPLKMNLAGQDFEFKDMDELQTQMNRFVAATETKLRAAQAPPPPKANATGDDRPTWNFDNFVEKMNKPETVPDAFDYTLQHTPRMQQLEQRLLQTEAILAVSQFQARHPELVGAPPEVGQAIENIRRNMGMPLNAESYEAALYLAQARGVIARPQPAPVAQTPAPDAAPAKPANNPYLAPPPSPGRNLAQNTQNFATFEERDDFYESLSIEELAQLKNQMAKHLKR